MLRLHHQSDKGGNEKMRIEEVKVLQFNELSDTAKERARKWYRNCLNNDFSFESDCIGENFEEALKDAGYCTDNLKWSLSSCQGDGVNFAGDIDLDVVLPRILTEKELSRYKLIVKAGMYFSNHKVKRNNRYTYFAGVEIEIDDESEKGHWCPKGNYGFYHDCKRVYAFMEKVADKIERDAKRMASKLERQGYKEIEYYYSDDYIDDTIICNEYEFTEDGERW